MMRTSIYHAVLRVLLVVVAMILVFDSGLFFPASQELSRNAKLYLANAIGVTAAIDPTEVNTLTAELTKQKTELDQRAASLAERELAIGLNNQTSFITNQTSTFILAVILFIILVLLVLNYALDYTRYQRLTVNNI